MTSRRTIAVLISLLLIVGVILSGCSTSNEYVKATAVKRGISFSFEYPPTYEKLTPDAFSDNVNDYSVSLLYFEPESTYAKADIQLYVIPIAPMEGRPDAYAWSEAQIKFLEEIDEKFELMESSAIQVSGIDGYKIVYFTTTLGNYLHSTKRVCRDVYLDYKEYIWKISALAVEESADQAEPVFQHLIESFQFLD